MKVSVNNNIASQLVDVLFETTHAHMYIES